MNWNIFEYAGHTAWAWTALMVSLVALLAVLGASGFLLLRRKWLWGAGCPLVLLVVWGICWGVFSARLGHAWLYLQENARRSHATYVGLTFATAFLPPSGDEGRGAFVHIATRDSGFAKGKPVSVTREHGHVVAQYEDEDYPGGVTTFDGRPVETGYRFRSTRLLVSLIPLFEMPTAKTVRTEGVEGWLYAKPLVDAGLTVQQDGPADIVLVAPEPDWMTGADTPTASDWTRIASGLSRDGVAALHLDARLLSRSRLKQILADFRAAFTHYRLWCTGRYDYVLTSGGNVLADEVLELFSNEKTAAAFVAADAVAPGEVFACYMGTDFEIEPGLLEIPAFGHARATWSGPRLAFTPAPTNHFAEVRAATLTPYEVPFPAWFVRGTVDAGIYPLLTNGVMKAQVARREILMGIDAADRGASTNAVEHWTAAAAINMRDPLLRGLADSMDLEGRRFLRIGNVNAAIRCYENRLLIRPNDVAAVHNFGVCLKKSGHLDMAATVFAKAVEMDPRADEHRYELVECCAASHREDLACRQLDVLMKRHPKDPALKMRAARLLCLRANKARDNNRAIALAEEAVKLTEWKDRDYVHALADVYIEAGRPAMGVNLKRKMKEMRFEK